MSRSLFVTIVNSWIYTRLLHLILCCEVIFSNRIRLKSRKHEQGNLNFDTVGEMNKIELTAWAFWYKTERKVTSLQKTRSTITTFTCANTCTLSI